MEPMLVQYWFMPQHCISPSLFILANEYNCYGIFYLFWGKLKLYWVMPNLQVQASKSLTDLHYPITRRHIGKHYLNSGRKRIVQSYFTNFESLN
jgi:hypothetical protein